MPAHAATDGGAARRAGRWQGRNVAIKTVLFQSSDVTDKTQLLAHEAAVATGLVHRNLVATYAHEIAQVPSTARGRRPAAARQKRGCVYVFFLLQELCNGGSLRRALEAGCFGADGVARRWRPLMAVLRSIAAGIQHMHSQDIVHSDLSSDNILFKVRRPHP